MYNDIAQFYDLMYGFKNYEAEANALKDSILTHHPAAKTLLDVGCGTGSHLQYLKNSFDVVGVDISEGLLRQARIKLPDVTFVQADMSNFELSRRFDVVSCMFGAIGYMDEVSKLKEALHVLSRHLTPGGVLIFEPWLSPGAFLDRKIVHNYVERDGTKVSWMYTQKREGDVSVFDIRYLVGDCDGVSCFSDVQRLGLYSEEIYRSIISSANLGIVHFDPHGIHGYGMFVCRR